MSRMERRNQRIELQYQLMPQFRKSRVLTTSERSQGNESKEDGKNHTEEIDGNHIDGVMEFLLL